MSGQLLAVSRQQSAFSNYGRRNDHHAQAVTFSSDLNIAHPRANQDCDYELKADC